MYLLKQFINFVCLNRSVRNAFMHFVLSVLLCNNFYNSNFICMTKIFKLIQEYLFCQFFLIWSINSLSCCTIFLHFTIIEAALLFSHSLFPLLWLCGPTQAMASSFLRFLHHTWRHITVGRTPLDEWSAHCRDLYLTTHNTHNRQTTMPPVVFEPTISAGEWPQTYALDCMATETGMLILQYTI